MMDPALLEIKGGQQGTKYVPLATIKFIGGLQTQRSPFASIDTVGVGAVVKTGVTLGRQTRPDLKVGVCGEHGGDPSSIHFFDSVGFDYVSCSPFRVPVARLAAAQAALKQKAGD